MARWKTIAFAVIWTMIAGVDAMACPNCKDGLLENGSQGASLARGFELSIYLMLGTPILILGGLGLLFYLQIRRARLNPEIWMEANHAVPISR